MARQKCDNARSLARPVAASRSLQREIMPSWQNCIVAARRFSRFSAIHSIVSLHNPPPPSPVSYRFTCFLEEEGGGEAIMLGWKRGDNAADDRVCLLIREPPGGGMIRFEGEEFWKTGSGKGSVDRYSLGGWKIRDWSWEGNQLILIERDSTSSECFEHRRSDARWF